MGNKSVLNEEKVWMEAQINRKGKKKAGKNEKF